ncbi:hypothetical protein TRICI_000822 [Trichomonascus ciferrii]|uniref:Histone-lysine N-methyltransferase n=1 Tax=Trichomonascus ciferrii TaxID=44093 RepID=A0A642VBX6_9ASCO|nr:hypothetical protein TRICI_000822 [Trichomonascus ciferrii]
MCNCTTRCAEDCINRLLQFECDATCCPFGKENCGNRALQTLSQQQRAGKRYATGYEIMWTKKKGYGLRATRAYSPGELIVEYTGDVVSQGEMKRRLNEDYSNLKNFYFLSLEKGHVIDSSVRGSEARFVNHSCSPNAEMQKWFVKDKPRVGLFAKTAIPAGIEITYDYNFNWFPGAIAQKCYCGSKNCRGYISKKTYTNPSSSSPDSAEPDDQPAVTSTNTTRRRAARESEPLPPPKQTRSRARKSLPANFEVSSRISSLRNRSELEEEGDDEDEEEEGEEGEDEEEDEVLERETNKAAETLIVKKRGPGRPRKYPRKEAAEEPIVMPENYDEQGMIDEEQPNGYIETNPVPTAFEFDSDSEGAPGVLPPTKHASSTLHSSKNSTSAFQRFALDSVNGMVENGSQSKPLQSPRRKIKRVADLLNEDETFVSVRKRGPGRPPKRPRVSFIPGDKPQTDGVLIDLSGDTVKVNTNTNTNGYINGDHQPNGRYERTTSSGNSALKENIVNQGHNKTEHALVPNGSLSNVANDKPYDLPTLTPGSIGKKPPYFVKLRASEIPTNGNSDEDKPSEPRKRLVRQIGSGRQLKPLPDVIFNSRGVTDLVNSIYTLAS